MPLPILPTDESCCQNASDSDDDEKMSFSQRLCLQHVLKNSAMGLDVAIALVQEQSFVLTPGSLAAVLRDLVGDLSRCVDYLESGTFCPIPKEECVHVSKYVGCNRVNSVTLNKKSGIAL